jgi:hypothetical protein
VRLISGSDSEDYQQQACSDFAAVQEITRIFSGEPTVLTPPHTPQVEFAAKNAPTAQCG